MLVRRVLLGLLLLPLFASAQPSNQYAEGGSARGLKNVSVLIVRHAEKPDQGRGLAPEGERRAKAYATYFDPLRLDGESLQPQRLIATSDSKSSDRPRLTLTPLAVQLRLPLEQPYADNEVSELVDSLRASNQAGVLLIAWHHGRIDDLVSALGGDMPALTGEATWPDDVYNWLIVMRFDEHGQLKAPGSQLVHAHLLPDD